MSDYDYLNTRVRAMSRFLLGNDVLEQLLAARSEETIIDALLDTPYGEDLRESLTEYRGLAAAEDALRRNLSNTVQKVRFIAPEEPRRLLSIQLNRWDVQNVLSVIRGKMHGSDSGDIIAAFVPVGEFKPAQLGELAAEREIGDVADALTTWDYRFAYVIRRCIRENNRGISPREFEQELFQSFFEWALVQLRAEDENERILRDHLKAQIDLMNVINSLRVVDAKTRGGSFKNEQRLAGGSLQGNLLAQIESRANIAAALETLEDTFFSSAVERGILVYGQTNRLSVLERFFETVIIERGVKMFRGDPFSISVPLGFLWRKINEYLNLRMLLRGTLYEMPTNTIREEMFLV